MGRVRQLFFGTFIAPGVQKRQHAAIEAVRSRGKARVAIIASSLSMWRLEGVLDLMKQDPEHFDARIFLIPFAKLNDSDKQAAMQQLREHFDSVGIAYSEGGDAFEAFDPDIIFYPQFYLHSFNPPARARDNEHKLLCYSPYGVMFIDRAWQYNSRFHNRAWRIFLQSSMHFNLARRFADNRAANVVVVGDADADRFLTHEFNDPWKGDSNLKRVIWAPHHKKLGRDSFGWTAELMQTLAKEYEGRIQFAFKPHPRLKTELYKTEGWGPERTDAYYAFWAEGANTQLETGTFVELFRGSDAMIHDCNSFIAEYHYTGKPVLFLTRSLTHIRRSIGRFGAAALDAHYISDRCEDIRGFLDNVVLGGNDPKRVERRAFYEEYLKPAGDRGFSACVVESIRKELFGSC